GHLRLWPGLPPAIAPVFEGGRVQYPRMDSVLRAGSADRSAWRGRGRVSKERCGARTPRDPSPGSESRRRTTARRQERRGGCVTVLLALLSVAVGALLGGVVNALVGRYAAFKETQAVAAALRAELEVMLAVDEYREHARSLQVMIEHLNAGTGPPAADDFYETTGGSQDTYPIFRANCGKLGLLGNAAESVAAAYMRFI